MFIIFTTDVWLYDNSFRVEGIATTLTHAIKMIKYNKELIQPVLDNDGCIVIKEYKKNILEDGTIVFNTQYDFDKNKII